MGSIAQMFIHVSCLCAKIFRKAALLFGWLVFLLLAYKVSKLDREYQEYNPYEVLSLDPVNTHTKQMVYCKATEVLRVTFLLFILYYLPFELK